MPPPLGTCSGPVQHDIYECLSESVLVWGVSVFLRCVSLHGVEQSPHWTADHAPGWDALDPGC